MIFETMLVVRGRLVQRQEHEARMRASCAALGIALPPPFDFTADDGALRVVWDGRTLTSTPFDIPAATLARREHGRAITTSAKRELPQHKLTAPYAVCTNALREAIARGADEALFVDDEGRVLEGTSTNVFAVRGETLITAPDQVLAGIVRAWVLAQHARVELRPPSLEEIKAGAFFTGSLTKLAQIRMLNGEACAEPGALFEELAARYEAACAR